MSDIPVLEKLTGVVVETIVEAIQKKPWTAFIDNSFAATDIAFRHKRLAADFLAVEKDQNLLDELEAKVLQHRKFKELDESKAGEVFKVVWQMIVFNSKGVLKIKSIIEE